MNLFGRVSEVNELTRVADSQKSSFIALFGRRRIGKTYLVNEFFSDRTNLRLYVMGERGQPLKRQLENFQTALEQTFYQGARISKLSNWRAAFNQLVAAIKLRLQVEHQKEILIFLDELPWLATPKSDLLSALDYSWNTELSNIPQVRLVVAGSAASWIINNIVRDTGGLHNRLTTQIRLLPFDFRETRDYCLAKGNEFSISELAEIYLCFGGVAYYLDHLTNKLSAAQNIDRLLFKPSALSEEYPLLLQALFKDSQKHKKIISTLGKHPQGLERNEIVKETKFSSGGGLSEALEELECAGFVGAYVPYGFSEKRTIYRITDEYMTFYMHWLKNRSSKGLDAPSWFVLRKTPAYYAWAGYAFESLLLKHHKQIKRALGFSAVESITAPWRSSASSKVSEPGCQIDLLFDRADDVIVLCEIKHTGTSLKVDNLLLSELRRKEEIFIAHTKTRKRIQWVVINNHEGSEKADVRVLSAKEIFDF